MPAEFDPTWGVPSPPPIETRQQSSPTTYTDLRISALLAQASGRLADPQAIAATEIAAGLWGRAFACATVKEDRDALTAPVLEIVGRELVRQGEAVFSIVVEAGRVVLRPVAYWDVYGEPEPSSWTYETTVAGPSLTRTRRVSGAAVVHPRYACKPSTPWQGQSPLALQRETAELASWLEHRLRQEAAAEVGRLLPVPDPDKEDLKTSLQGMAGRTVLVKTTAGGWGNPDQTPATDWQPRRVGADPPEHVVDLRNDAARSVLSACGVPVQLVEASAGSAEREAWRRFIVGTVNPAADIILPELREKLDSPGLMLDFESLLTHDLSGKARSFQALVGGGMSTDKAAAIAGLMEPE